MAIIGSLAARRSGDESEARALLERAAAGMDPNAWPYPIVAYLMRAVTARILLEAADEPSRATEAHLFIGLDRLLNGDQTGAAEELRWIRYKAQPGSPALDIVWLSAAEARSRVSWRTLALTGQSDSRPPDTGTSPGVATIFAAELELAAGARAVVIVTALAAFGIEPDARRAEIRAAVRLSGRGVGKELGQQVGPLPSEPLPGVLPALVEHAVERRAGHDLAACPQLSHDSMISRVLGFALTGFCCR